MKLTERSEWKALASHFTQMKGAHLRDLFSDAGRAVRFSLQADDLLLDYSKNRITTETMELLLSLAESADLKPWIEAMFTGEKINATENRAVLHVALRSPKDAVIEVDGENIIPKVHAVLEQMEAFSDQIRSGDWKGHTGQSIKNIVNIGIGGSDLGPVMAYEALKCYSQRALHVVFVSNVDGTHLAEALRGLDAAETLFIVASKTFTTQETMTNAHSARAWCLDALKDEVAVAKHFVALSTNAEAVAAFGIDTANMFAFWDWVGGRYSLTSAIGLPLMMAIGPDHYRDLLAGYHKMDTHFRTAPFAENMPVILALLGIWYNNFFGLHTHAVLPYDQYLRHLPAYLQQLDMESCGKSVTAAGEPVEGNTGMILWGGTGTDAQHAVFQLLHQGTHLVPVDFIASIAPGHDLDPAHHEILLMNCFAQGAALMAGKESDDEDLGGARAYPGDRPSATILCDDLDAAALGALIAFHEHRVFANAAL